MFAKQTAACRLDIPLGSMRLHDQLVWDVNDSAADPDLFATAMCVEQSLDRAFAPLIAWHIRDQVLSQRHPCMSCLSDLIYKADADIIIRSQACLSPEAPMHVLPEWFDWSLTSRYDCQLAFHQQACAGVQV